MEFMNAGLAILTVGYMLGVWTVCALRLGSPERSPETPATTEVVWISERRQ